KQGRLGGGTRCVVSVSMLTEGWDANTVTHVLGVRAFGTQLLCEQVVGRGLRRMSYVVNEQGMFDPEYAEVYGVPFSFIPCSGAQKDPKPGRATVLVRALEERAACEITFPRLIGYVHDLPRERLRAEFSADMALTLSSQNVPLQTEVAPIFGEHDMHRLRLEDRREQEVAFVLARRVIEKFYPDGSARAWLFPQVLRITRDWMEQCVTCKDHAFKQMLLLTELADRAAAHIHRSISASAAASDQLRPLLQPYDTIGSTRYVDFDTTKQVYLTDARKCQVSHVVADSGWEPRAAAGLEHLPEVLAYVKNQSLGFTIPYVIGGEERKYIPDFLVLLDDGRGADDPLHVIVEVTGARRDDKAVKVDTARKLWIPAVNNHGGYGRWAFIEVLDPWNIETQMREELLSLAQMKVG
ncbi:MAG: BPTD_3080 family restriction endonuclease, partial [Ktedonobacterales bacterium]